MAIASSLGVGHLQVPMAAPLSLGLGGNAVTVSTVALGTDAIARCRGRRSRCSSRRSGRTLKAVVSARAEAGKAPLTFAMVYPFSCHNYELRYWLAAAGVDPDHDVRLVVLPPPLLVDRHA